MGASSKPKTSGEKLRQLMESYGFSTYSLAKKAGVPESSIKNIVYGKSNKPRLPLIAAISKPLKCDIRDLLADEDPRRDQPVSVIMPVIKRRDKDEVWNGTLYVASLRAVMESAEEANLRLTHQKAINATERVYSYAIMNNDSNVDQKFARYVVTDIAA